MSLRQRKFLDKSLFVPAKKCSKRRKVPFELLHELSSESSWEQRTKFAHFTCITFAQYCISHVSTTTTVSQTINRPKKIHFTGKISICKNQQIDYFLLINNVPDFEKNVNLFSE